MSLIYVRNGKGPTTDPWRTPHVTFKKEDLESPILVHWNLLSEQEASNFRGVPFTPY